MIPSVLAHHVEQGIKDFLRTTFPVSTPFFAAILDQLLEKPGSVFKGPYLDIQLPFQPGKGKADFFRDLPLPFHPHLHQEEAFRRLSGPDQKATIVATGTGSGKTECFLYPVLDHCFRHRGEPGIKAILIYPMNALATDQAGRLAKIIHGNSRLQGHVTAGIYVGQQEKDPAVIMEPERLISDKEIIRSSPPDILLTNYKMLDYLLIRPGDRALWQHNTSETLRYLVVDELHTFDGAQGADLGCLIRRLKARLGTEPGYLCPVGTSATLGSDEAQSELLDYATSVFGEEFKPDSIITESRRTAGEFLGDSLISRVTIVVRDATAQLDPSNFNRFEDYIRQQYRIWFNEEIPGDFADAEWRIKLGERLKEHLFFQNLLKTLGGKILDFDEIFSRLQKVTPELAEGDDIYRKHLLGSLLALVSVAGTERAVKKDNGETDKKVQPFLNVRLQLWLRELRRMVSRISPNPDLRFADDLNEEQLQHHLPLVHCRECGSMGWTGLKRINSPAIDGELKAYYNSFFKHDPKVVYLFPEDAGQDMTMKVGMYYFCPGCLNVTSQAHPEQCPNCGHSELILVYMPDSRRNRGDRQVSVNECPYCGTPNSLTLLGSRAASLTSVLIVQLFSSSFNDDKKLLTFSDNVQDAAHRAGFFNGRTYRFNFRTALQQVILAGADGLSLAEISEAFRKYWANTLDDDKYIATFLAPNMEWLQDFEILTRTGSLPDSSNLRQLVDKRIGWEIISEYGFQARIGRTLEKTGSSVAMLSQDKLEQILDSLLESLHNEVGMLRDLDRGTLAEFLLGLIVHLKNQGAIYQPVLQPYIKGWGNTYTINTTSWMVNFGRNSRTPSFLTTRQGTRFDRLFSSSPTHRTWYQNWVEKCFLRFSPLVLSISREIYELVLQSLISADILKETAVGHDRVWGVLPEALIVSADVRQLQCEKCGHRISVAALEQEFFNGAYCQRFHCEGRYTLLEKSDDYYGKLYANGDVERIFAREHTGLLKRSEREELEREFKTEKDRKPWFSNLLSCTPTLEMGIDIGNLSSLILCSVPPAQANYLQRIGRAGRRDGNALNLTVANARPHDLYFFAEPEAMLAGHVESPGIFLDASAVLERQFTAFSFDRWIATDTKANLPDKLGKVLNNLKSVDLGKFPHNFLYFIENNQTDLLDQFFALFQGKSALSSESVKNLKTFVKGNEADDLFLRGRIMNGLHSRNRERESLRKKVRILTGKIKKKKQEPKDKNYHEELRELAIEKSALQALIRNITDRNIFNFFTDEGLLPNYAFPEVGVMLNSLIYRKKQKVQDGESSYDSWTYEYERPAVSAISELAPANTFYAGGRKVRIDQVDMNVSEVETWRFCDNCSHHQLLGREEEKETCVKCGSSMWSDGGQKRLMLRMRQVFSSTADQKSRISDDSDDRDPVFYNKQMLVEFDEKQVMEAYKVDADFPFGFDFLSKVDFCEINFGEQNEIGEKVTIAGVEMPRTGFAVCGVCGKVQQEHNDPVHALTCTARDQSSDEHVIDCLYLYRQFVSEAIRILLPVDIIIESERKLQSFIAAIQLGLKRRFKGKIDHLQTTVYEEPLEDSSLKRKYLVLYDTVPGGTGYLKQLMRSKDELMDVLACALEALKSCPCNQEQDKDGCYRCLFAYRNSYNMNETSRNIAIDLLAEILGFREQLVKTERIGNISLNTFLESELEARFIGALKQFREDGLTVSLKNDLVNGKPGYFLKVGDKSYYIEPQVDLGELQGVSISSRADFVIRPARSSEMMLPIAVFLDGYAFHRDRVGLDMAQRMAITQSGKYRIWSLTWHDVENVFKTQNNYFVDYLDTKLFPLGQNFSRLLQAYQLDTVAATGKLTSFEMLIHFLRQPEEDKWGLLAFVYSSLGLEAERFKDSGELTAWKAGVDNLASGAIVDKVEDTICPCIYGWVKHETHGKTDMEQFVVIEQRAVAPPADIAGVRICCVLDDRQKTRVAPAFKAAWNGFLRWYNLFQFLPYAFFLTSEGTGQNAYDGLKLYEPAVFSSDQEKETAEQVWQDVWELTDPELHEFLNFIQQKGWSEPEIGFELITSDGEVIGSAEIAWEEKKVAFLLEDELGCKVQFENAGWTVHLITEVLMNPEAYV